MASTLPDPFAPVRDATNKHRVKHGCGAYPYANGALLSTLAAAAVHSGALRPGEAGMVRVTVLGPVPAYVGSTQNGLTSNNYGAYNGYRIDGRVGGPR